MKNRGLILNILYKKLYLGTFFQIIKKDSAPSITLPSCITCILLKRSLYWKFIDRHKKFFLKNPRLAMMVRISEKMNKERKTRIFKAANNFIKENTNG